MQQAIYALTVSINALFAARGARSLSIWTDGVVYGQVWCWARLLNGWNI